MNVYPLDSTVRLSVEFTREADDQPQDPSDVQLYLLAPGEALETYTYSSGQLRRDGVGLYHMDALLGLPGRWKYGFIGSGILEQSTGDIIIQVLPSSLFGRQLSANASIQGGGGVTA